MNLAQDYYYLVDRYIVEILDSSSVMISQKNVLKLLQQRNELEKKISTGKNLRGNEFHLSSRQIEVSAEEVETCFCNTIFSGDLVRNS